MTTTVQDPQNFVVFLSPHRFASFNKCMHLLKDENLRLARWILQTRSVTWIETTQNKACVFTLKLAYGEFEKFSAMDCKLFFPVDDVEFHGMCICNCHSMHLAKDVNILRELWSTFPQTTCSQCSKAFVSAQILCI